MAEVGRIGRAHGLDGSFHVTQPRPGLDAEVLGVSGVARRVQRRAGTSQRPILRLEGLEDRPAIDALRGVSLDGPEPELEPGEYRAEDLAGCRVVDGDSDVGTVARMIALPSCEALELDDGRLIPMVSDAVRSVDLSSTPGVIDANMAFLGPGPTR